MQPLLGHIVEQLGERIDKKRAPSPLDADGADRPPRSRTRGWVVPQQAHDGTLSSIRFADSRIVEPASRLADFFERIILGEKNSIGVDLQDCVAKFPTALHPNVAAVHAAILPPRKRVIFGDPGGGHGAQSWEVLKQFADHTLK